MSGFTSTIRWVLVRAPATQRKSTEFDFAVADLRRQLPAAQWHFDGEELTWLNPENAAYATDKVLLLEHPWLTVEARCLERLELALQQGYDIVQACDSGNPSPMPAPDYATLRGIERYVEKAVAKAGESPCVPVNTAANALMQLSTLEGLLKEAPSMARVRGAYVHDVSGYFGGDRAEVLPLIPPHAQRFMDVGGGEGRFLAAVKATRPTAETQLVEMDTAAAQLAQQHQRADAVWNGNFFDFVLNQEDKEDKKFDCISFLDMLEHVTQPEACLVHAKTLLSENGVVLASIPNVGHWSVVADLLEGRWDYVPAGIHCITHVRFFTEQSVRDLFTRAGLVIQRIERTRVPASADWLAQWRVACQATGLKMDADSLDTYAFLVVAS